MIYILSFSAGVLSILSPCVLPLIPILFSTALSEQGRFQGILFFVGFITVFVFIIILTAILTAAVNQYLYYVRILSSIVLILMGAVLLFELSPNLSNRFRESGSSFSRGFLTSLAWTPCYSPYLITLIAYLAQTGNWAYTVINIALYTTGFTFALFLITLMARVSLNRIILTSENIRRLSGLFITIGGIYMLYQLLG